MGLAGNGLEDVAEQDLDGGCADWEALFRRPRRGLRRQVGNQRVYAPKRQLAAPEAREVNAVETLEVSLYGVVVIAEQDGERG